MALIIAAIVVSICLILLGLMGDFLADWLWVSAIGYLYVFWTTIGTQAEVFFAVFVATAIILWVNGSLASRLPRRHGRSVPPTSSGYPRALRGCPTWWNSCANGCRGPLVIAGGATCPMARTTRSTKRTSASISFRGQPMSLSRIGCRSRFS